MDIVKIAKISRVLLDESRIQMIQKEIDDIISWMNIVKKIATTLNKEPLFDVMSQDNHRLYLADSPLIANNDREKILFNTQNAKNGFIVVPNIMDEN